MAQRGNLGEQAGLDSLARRELRHGPLGIHQQLDGLEGGRERRLDEIFTLTNEQAKALTLVPRGEPADEAQSRIRRRRDHYRSPSHSSH